MLSNAILEMSKVTMTRALTHRWGGTMHLLHFEHPLLSSMEQHDTPSGAEGPLCYHLP